MSDEAWFAGLDPDDVTAAAAAIRDGAADAPADWPRLGNETGFTIDDAE